MKPCLLVNSLKMNYALLENFLNEAPRENDFSSGLRLHSFFPHTTSVRRHIQPITAHVQRGRQVKPYTSNSGFCCDTYAFAPWQGQGRSGMAAVFAVSAHSRPLSELIQQLFSDE